MPQVWLRPDDVAAPVNALFGAMDQQRVLGQRDRALANDERYQNALLQERADVRSQNQAAASSEQELLGKWEEISRVAELPEQYQAQWVAQNAPEYHGVPPSQVVRAAQAGLAARMGKTLPEVPQPITPPEVRSQGGYSYMFDPQKGVVPGSVQAPQRAPIAAPRETYRTLTPAEVQQAGFPEGSVVQVGPDNRFNVVRDPSKGGGGITVGPNGELIADPGKSSEGERVSAGYLGRMRNASSVMESEDYTGYVPSMPAFMGFASLLDDETGIVGATVANSMLDDKDRQYLGQALDFILAKMRKESGATIKGGEFRKEYINYFPMPKDSQTVLEQKRKKRELAMKQLETTAGRSVGAVAPSAPPASGPARIRYDQNGKRIP